MKKKNIFFINLLKNIVLISVSIVFTLALIEILLAYTKPVFIHTITSKYYQSSLNPDIAYELKPLVRDHNVDGIRADVDYALKKPNGVYRILVAGDSLAYGLGVTLENTYSKQLEKKLNEYSDNNLRYEVINLGVPGYRITQVIERIKDKGLKYDPDFIIYGYWLDDIAHSASQHETNLVTAAYDGIKNTNRITLTDNMASQTVKNILLRSQIVRRVILFQRSLQYKKKQEIKNEVKEKGFNEYIKNNLDPKVASLYEDYLKEYASGRLKDLKGFEFYYAAYANPNSFIPWNKKLEEFSALAAKEGIDTLLCMTPVIYHHDARNYNWSYLHSFIQKNAGCHNIPSLNLQNVFSGKKPEEIGIGDYEHPNALGNELIASQLLNYFIQKGKI